MSFLSRRLARSQPLRLDRYACVRRQASDSPEYNEPSGYLFGEKPLPKGQKRIKEDWENLWVVGMTAFFGLGTLIAIYKPKTGVQDWALVEAQKSLEERGVNLDYPKSGK
ncbi:9568_t:CDS:2 [Paraglomus brasilianum]|uniref:NADH dehydrogenase [ubiquinone] 1 beta subcomplex subunit 11, mitochondrial n=1 Tax=Paraglomus brasilianum TaxID=144538 RepID=A0A9N9G3P6_9GLOM|nr:9568_t:CDS:2 [Paraglomus brasilianum]